MSEYRQMPLMKISSMICENVLSENKHTAQYLRGDPAVRTTRKTKIITPKKDKKYIDYPTHYNSNF